MKNLELQIGQPSLTLAEVLKGADEEALNRKGLNFLRKTLEQPTSWLKIKVTGENSGLLRRLLAGEEISPKDKARLRQELTKGTNPKIHDTKQYSNSHKEGKPKESGRSSRKRRSRPHRPMTVKISEFWK